MADIFEPRFNREAEEAVLGIALTYPAAIPKLVADLTTADFYLPAAASVFSAIVSLYQSGHAIDSVTLADSLTRLDRFDAIGGGETLLRWMRETGSPNAVGTYTGIIRREAAARSIQKSVTEARQQIDDNGDPVVVAEELSLRLSSLDRGGKLPGRYWADSADYAAEDHAETVTPLAEGVCNPLSRIMVIASEKSGKSVLLRSIAFCMAAGIHPFDPRLKIRPVKTLLFDAENDDDELAPTMERIRKCAEVWAGADAPRPGVYSVPYGVDLASRRDRGDFLAVLEDFRPELIVGGPVYKLTDQTADLSEDRRAAIVQSVFNDVRKRWGSAVILEHHAPTGSQGKSRDIKAKGGQVWPAWVNMTIGLHPINEGQSVEVRYPHPPRGSFRWPKQFDRGTMVGDWPWMPVLRPGHSLAPVQPALALPATEEPEGFAWDEEPF